MTNKVIMSEEIVWCECDDRHILIMKEHDEVIGLNFCQGDDLDCFINNYNEIDHDLTNFYNAICDGLNGVTEIDRINQAIWAWVIYKNDY